MHKKLVIVRGGGDIATGTVYRLSQSGYKVIVLETAQPTVIRHTVAVAQCVFSGQTEVEGMRAVLAASCEEALALAKEGIIPVIIDPAGEMIEKMHPDVVVDAILAKKNLGTKLEMAPIVIGLGPGFSAGKDVHAVIETMRGHYLGKIYYQGAAIPDTGVPGEIAGVSGDRIVRSPGNGSFVAAKQIGDLVEKEEVLGYVEGIPVKSPLKGVLRGLINEGVSVKERMKIGDIDPRDVKEHCRSISDKARAIAGGVLEAILHLSQKQ